MQELLKYKHYLILISALLIVKYALVPLYDNLLIEQSNYVREHERLNKIETLVEHKSELDELGEKQLFEVMKAEKLVYRQSDDSILKLEIQRQIEKILKQVGCDVEQVAWKGSVSINDSLKLWQLDTRYKGNASCLLNATREIESISPLIRIQSYFYGAKEITKGKHVNVTANLELVMWQYVKGQN